MSKEKTINFSNKETMQPNEYIAIFEDFIQNKCNGDYSIDNMLQGAALLNEKLHEEINDKEQDNTIIEAKNYIINKLFASEEDEQALRKRWKENPREKPFFLRIAEIKEYGKNKAILEATIENFSAKEKELYDKIMDTIWNNEEKRRVSLDGCTIYFSKTLTEAELQNRHFRLKRLVVDFILNAEGVNVLVFVRGNAGNNIVSALVNDNGNIIIMSKEKLKWNYSHDAITEEYIEPPKNEKYEEFNIKL